MINADFSSMYDLLKAFPDNQSCIDHLTNSRWKDGIVSPFDTESKVYVCKGNKYKCKNTGKYFNVKTATLFDNTKIELQKWFLSIWIVTAHKKGISSLQLSRDINVTQKTAWFMLQRIRNCFKSENAYSLQGWVEVDETYIGGKDTNRHEYKKRGKKDVKTPILGMVERGGKIIASIIDKTLEPIVTKSILGSVVKDSVVYTDGSAAYRNISKLFTHQKVSHSSGEYVNRSCHTNTIEGFWSLLKRSVYGIYHSTSTKHLQMYVDEMVFRYNTRETSDFNRFNLLLNNTEYRLKYSDLIIG